VAEPEPAGRVVVVAPDSFKGTFTAREVTEEIACGLRAGGIAGIRMCPVADGGEGTLDVLVGRLGGELREVEVRDPLGRRLKAVFGRSRDGRTAIVEAARAVGLELVGAGERDPEAASSAGVGDLIVAARDGGAGEIVIGLGGSATTDGGAGAIDAIAEAGGLRGVRLVVLCDVRTPFEQAAEVFGPQKGADPAAVRRLSERLNRLAGRLARDPRGLPMTGAAGGLSGGLWAQLDAELVGGASYVLDRLGFDRLLDGADAVITGEGRLDSQTAAGKAVAEVIDRARRAGVAVHAVVGTDALGREAAGELGLSSVREAGTRAELRAAGVELAGELRSGPWTGELRSGAQ
jgi:glycerate kinase